jgi:putative protein kinase ArgK-like GTPase of G3E family
VGTGHKTADFYVHKQFGNVHKQNREGNTRSKQAVYETVATNHLGITALAAVLNKHVRARNPSGTCVGTSFNAEENLIRRQLVQFQTSSLQHSRLNVAKTVDAAL